MDKVDVAIVGAGMAGSALACALVGQGLSIALIEARELSLPQLPTNCEVDSFDSRVSALNLQSSGFLGHIGVWPAIVDYRASAYSHMRVWDGEGTGAIEFDAREVDRDYLGHIVENRAVIHALLAKVKASSDISVLAPHRLKSIQGAGSELIQLQMEDNTTVSARLLVAADGALSSVRKKLDFATREWNYGHQALVATVQTEQIHGNTARQRFLATGPLAFLPLDDGGAGRLCSIVWSLKEALAEDMLALDDAAFCRELENAFESQLGRIEAASARFAFPLRQRHAVDYVQPRVALVADAAHTIHPLAGQGINLGFKDVKTLAQEIITAHERGADIGELAVLRRYQRQRKSENLLMMGAMDGFKFLFEQNALPLRWLRNTGMSGVGRSGPLKAGIMRHAMGL
ncbi:MAG: UbiH/UbiF/VisC/COQ6 family ubiquinone biosynthesis hydroxylase [Parahaliea sp.]